MFEMNYPRTTLREPWMDMPRQDDTFMCEHCHDEHSIFEENVFYLHGVGHHICDECVDEFHEEAMRLFAREIVMEGCKTRDEAYAYIDEQMERERRA